MKSDDEPSTKKTKNNSYCCVPQCSTYGRDMSVHIFPKEKSLRLKWKVALKMGKEINDRDRVCQEHFLPSDYLPQTSSKTRIFLKKTAIPSVNLPARVYDREPTTPEKKRAQGRKRRSDARDFQRGLEEGDGEEIGDDDGDVSDVSDSTENDHLQAGLEISLEPHDAVVANVLKNASTQTKETSLLSLLTTPSQLYTFTGISDMKFIDKFAECALKVAPDTEKMSLDWKLRISLCLVTLKLNLSYAALSVLFNISERTASNYFRDTIQVLAQILKGLVYWPKKEEVLKNMPKCFRQFWRTRVVLDCAEVPIDKPACLKERILSYSHYKGRHTMKFCVGVSPAGLITFISPCFGGRASDKKIVNESGILDKCEFDDAIMVDKGFLISEECLQRGLHLYRPPFLSKQRKYKLSKEEAQLTAQIARARVHVERVIQRLRNFKILSDQLSAHLLPYADDILLVCAALTNLGPPVLAMDKF